MKLTGKAKELFEDWYLKLPNLLGLNYGNDNTTLNRFYVLPLSMQWGIYQDWADSMKALMSVDAIDDWNSWFFRIYMEDCFSHFFLAYNSIDDFIEYKTRQEARNAAIEKLNQIINEQ